MDIANYKKLLNLNQADFLRVDHEDAMVAVVYKITQPETPPKILKICSRKNDFYRELYFLKHFKDRLRVPQVLQTVEPSDGIDGAILMECLEGDLLQFSDFTGALAFELGACLGKIHNSRTKGYGDPLGPLDSDPRPYFRLKFEEGLQECQGHLPQEIIDYCRRFFDSHIDLLQSVDGPCIVHRDFRPGNIIVRNKKISGIIDWAGARFSFAEEDFCALEHGEWPNKAQSKEAFLQGYESIRQIPDYTSLMPLLRLNKAIATVGFTVKRGTWNNKNASIYKYNREYLDALMVKKPIVVVPYNDEWPNIFEAEACKIKKVLGDNLIDLHHVGSTAVPGLTAKPVIDMIAVVKNPEDTILSLENLGFAYKGEYNIPMRYYFNRSKGVEANLHVYEEGNPEIELNLIFRDYLRDHPAAREEYAILKANLLKDPASYEKKNSLFTGYNLGKDAFIRKTLKMTNFNRLRITKCTHYAEWDAIKRMRKGSGEWEYDPQDHVHMLLSHGTDIVGYAHIEFLDNGKAALRFFSVDDPSHEKPFLSMCKKWLAKQGIEFVA